jgi:hypothetical protein
VQLVLLAELRANPIRTLSDFATVLTSAGWPVNADFIKSRFTLHGISLKKAKRRHRAKYSGRNVVYTLHYLVFIRGIDDWTRLKFVDESSFESKSARTAVRSLRPSLHSACRPAARQGLGRV